MAKRKKIKADALPGGDSPSRFQMYPGADYEEDPSIHSPKAPDVPAPSDLQNPDKGFLKEAEGKADHDDMVLTQPMRYVVDPKDAIEKMEALNRKVEESRPDLAPQVAQVEQAIQQLEHGAHGEGYAAHEAAEGEAEVAVFNPGDNVVVTLEDGTYRGTVEMQSPDGTYVVHTDQAMTLQNVPATALALAEVTTMTLPASLKKRIEAARMVTDTIAEAFINGKKRRVANTSTDGQTIWLHNNAIARKSGDGSIEITLAGWPTVTTRERLNGLMQALGINKRVSQRGGTQMLDGKPWDGEWTNIGSPQAAAPAEAPVIEAGDKNIDKEIEDRMLKEDEGIEDEEGPAPEDYTITPSGPLGSKYSVGQVEGDHLGEFVEWEDAAKAIRDKMEKEQFWPSVWFISDHGNVSPADISASTKVQALLKPKAAVYEDGEEAKVGDIVTFMDSTLGKPEQVEGKVKVVREYGDRGPLLVQVKNRSYSMHVFTQDVLEHRRPADNMGAGMEGLVKASKKFKAKIKAKKIKADFMKKFIYGPMDGAEVETTHGTWFLPSDVYLAKGAKNEPTPELVKDYVEGEVKTVEPIHGYFGRFSAPGYMDATDWLFDKDEKALDEELERLYGLEEGEDEGEEVQAGKKVKAAPAVAEKPAGATAPTSETFSQPAKARSGYKPTGVKVVEEGGNPRLFDPNKDDVEPAELVMNEKGQIGLANPDGKNSYEDQAGDPLEIEYWKQVKTLAPKAEAAPVEDAEAKAKANVEKYAKKAGVKAAAKAVAASARQKIKAKKFYSAELREAPGEFLNTGMNSSSPEELKKDLADLLKQQNPEENYNAEELETLLSDLDCVLHVSSTPVKASLVKASAFDEIPEIEIGGGYTARRKKPTKEEGANDGETEAQIEVVDADGKVKATYPDAFGDDTVTIIKFLRQVLDIKETDDKKAAKKEANKEEKGEGGGSDVADKPKALPATDGKEGKDTKKEEEEVAKKMEARLEEIRLMAARLLRAGYIQANMQDVDDALLAGKNLAEAQAVAAKKAVDRKVMDLLAQPQEELLIIKASLPHLEARKVTVPASDGGLAPINISASGVIDPSRNMEISLGAAFGRGFRR